MRKIALVFAVLLCSTVAVFAQTTIKGKITDSKDGTPVSGASIKVRGESASAVSKADGSFEVSAKSAKPLLEISEVGHISQAVNYSGSGDIEVKLVADAKSLSEVVVTALGFTYSKDRLASSQSTVKGAAIIKSGETSVLQGLASKSSGVQVQRSGGDPGAGAYIQIRGQSTITGNTQPLVIIDGNPVFNSNLGSSTQGVVEQSRLSDINPNDIASVEILKSAAAASLWGTEAINGVILVTTKKGRKSDKLNISFSSTLSIDQLNKSVPLQTSYGQGTGGRYSNTSSSSWGDKIADRAGTPDVGTTTGEYTLLEDGTKRYPIANGTAANVHGGKTSKDVFDHSKDLFRNGVFYDNSIALSGGDERSTFYASIANLTQKGIAKAGSDYDRWSFRVNADRRFGSNFKLATGIAYSNISSNRLQQGSNLNGIFLGGLRTAPDFNK